MKKIIAYLSLLFIGLTPSHPSQEVQSVDNAIVLDKDQILGTTEGDKTEKPISITLSNIKSLKEKLQWADLTNADFTDIDCTNICFANVVLKEAIFKRANCKKVVFQSAKCQSAKFIESDLARADFKWANLGDTDFTDSDLKGADFTADNCQNAIFIGAKMYYSDIKKYKLEGRGIIGYVKPEEKFIFTIIILIALGLVGGFIYHFYAKKKKTSQGHLLKGLDKSL